MTSYYKEKIINVKAVLKGAAEHVPMAHHNEWARPYRSHGNIMTHAGVQYRIGDHVLSVAICDNASCSPSPIFVDVAMINDDTKQFAEFVPGHHDIVYQCTIGELRDVIVMAYQWVQKHGRIDGDC